MLLPARPYSLVFYRSSYRRRSTCVRRSGRYSRPDDKVVNEQGAETSAAHTCARMRLPGEQTIARTKK